MWGFRHFVFQVACVIHANFIDEDSNSMFMLGNGLVFTRDQLKQMFLMGENFVELMFNFSIRFNAFRLKSDEIALFCALMLITPGEDTPFDFRSCDLEMRSEIKSYNSLLFCGQTASKLSTMILNK